MVSKSGTWRRVAPAALLALSLVGFGSASANDNSQGSAHANANSASDFAFAWSATADAVTITSSAKVFSYVVVLYCNGAVEKVDSISGKEVTLSGNGMISSAMAKAGSSSDTAWAPNQCKATHTIPW